LAILVRKHGALRGEYGIYKHLKQLLWNRKLWTKILT